MSYPVVSSSNSNGGLASSHQSVSAPSGLAVGDLMLLGVSLNLAGGAGDGSIMPPAGWATLFNRQVGSPVLKVFALFSKVANSADVSAGSFAITFTGSNSSSDSLQLGIIRITHPEGTPTIEASNDSLNSSAPTALNTSGISPVREDLLIEFIIGGSTSGAGRTVSGYAVANHNPGAWTEVLDTFASGTSGTLRSNVAIACGNSTAGGSTGNATASFSSAMDSGDLMLVAIKAPFYTATAIPMTIALPAVVYVRKMLPAAIAMTIVALDATGKAISSLWKNDAKHDSSWTDEQKS